MTFDLDMDRMTSSSFGVSSFTTTKYCDSSLAKKLEKKIKGNPFLLSCPPFVPPVSSLSSLFSLVRLPFGSLPM